MNRLSDEYYERACFFKTKTVPTQSVMKKRMTPNLAKIYFKSMRPKLQVLAGLAPPMKGGGSDWYIPPKELLKGRAPMTPIKKEFLSKLGYEGIVHLGERIVEDHNRKMGEYKKQKLAENNNYWMNVIDEKCREKREECEKNAALENTKKIELALHQYCNLYSTSLTQLEDLLLNAAIADIKRVKAEAFQHMQARYDQMVKQQATTLYDYYTKLLEGEKERIKEEFINNLEDARYALKNQLHDINVEKHVAVEKMRHLLECQNLACQVYVALKEREECANEIEESKRKHEKKVKVLKDQLLMKDFEIKLAKEKEMKRREFQQVWYKKICEVVKKFQLFVQYSLKELPEYADFFINTEKLLLMQMSDVMETPDAGSIFEFDHKNSFHTPIPAPHPYFLFCDKGYKPTVDKDLCPKHCTSSASQLPVIIINKRCIYAACDNFEMFTDKVTQYIHGKRGDDADFVDYHDYAAGIPVKYSSSAEIQHLQLQSSLLQILQQEWANVRNLPLECCNCKIPYCFCSRLKATPLPSRPQEPSAASSRTESLYSGCKIVSRDIELEHERQPKWESYLEYVKSKRCDCAKMAKKHLEEHLPPYMRQTSQFDAPDIPHYETCDLETLKRLVRISQRKHTPPPEPKPPVVHTRDAEVQYSDIDFEYICTCFSDEEVDKFLQITIKDSKVFDASMTKTQCRVVSGLSGSLTPPFTGLHTPSFATRRAYSLRNLLSDSPELEEIFRKKTCSFN